MAKVQLKAGVWLDTLTQPEIDASLTRFITSWRKETQRGDSYRRFARTRVVASDGSLTIGGTDSGPSLGPEEGMVWAVTRIGIFNALSGGTPVVRVYRNAADPSTYIRTMAITAGDSSHEFGGPGLILMGGNKIMVTGTGLTAGTSVTLTGDAREVPGTMLWRLGGS